MIATRGFLSRNVTSEFIQIQKILTVGGFQALKIRNCLCKTLFQHDRGVPLKLFLRQGDIWFLLYRAIRYRVSDKDLLLVYIGKHCCM